MLKTYKTLAFVAMIALSASMIAGCNKEEKLSFESVEAGRHQANENAEYNAKNFRQTHPEYSGYSIAMNADSTQSVTCGQGDGWSSIGLVNVDKQTKVPLKCSTVSAEIGCMTDADFKTKSYAGQDGRCDENIPFPLPKIQK